MFVVGLTGGIASGKSVVSEILRKLGAQVIDADEISREVMVPHTKCWKEVVTSYGSEILREDLTIDREKLANSVFNNTEQLDKLNRIVHPEIMKRIDERLREIRLKYPQAIVIVDAALLVETGAYKSYDKLIVVYVNEEMQLKRLINRDGMSREEAKNRIILQLPLSEKVKVADYIIENEGSLVRTRENAEKVFKELSSLTSTRSSVNEEGLSNGNS
jgi:dephospho-CoA kinase